MYHIQPEDREDDKILTPRAQETKKDNSVLRGDVTMFDHYTTNADSILFQR